MKFWKYQGAGNDFIMLDQRERRWLSREDTGKIAQLCHRRFGIGADGLILLQNLPDYDFEMIYFNADGRESSMCGNGGRCIAAFARHLGFASKRYLFWAIDGEHEAILKEKKQEEIWVELKMGDVQNVEQQGNIFVLNTGSPHYVRFENDLENLDIVQEGRAVRYSERFKAAGINVNLAKTNADGSLVIRTYERGVEDETLACGTGVTAAAIASSIFKGKKGGHFDIEAKALGGNLAVRFTANSDGSFSDIWLCGPAKQVFEGEVSGF